MSRWDRPQRVVIVRQDQTGWRLKLRVISWVIVAGVVAYLLWFTASFATALSAHLGP